MEKFDAIIIGFGKGGKTLAGHLASQGKKVAMIEKSKMMYGGTCINVGCIPSKSLVQSASNSASKSNATFAQLATYYQEAIIKKTELTASLRQKNYDKLNTLKNVTVIDGIASFKDSHTVQVQQEHDTFDLHAPYIFINTGSLPVIPKIEGIENNPYVYFSDTLMALPTLPKELVIIGGGYIGLEFASMYANFGSQVTVLQDGETFLPREDEDMALEIKKVLEKQGITIKVGVNIKAVTKQGEVNYTHLGKEYKQAGNAILVATGRRPNIENLHLERAGVTTTSRGAIQVNKWRQTSMPHIFAMGDVVGGLQFTYVSLDDYRIVANYLSDKKSYNETHRGYVPYSVFMDTPYSRVGLNEKEAREAGYTIKVSKLPTMAIPKAQVLQKPAGMLKAIIDTKTNKILGAMLLCVESYEMINIVKLAMDLHADYTILKNQIFTHPTMSEALNDLFTM